jgi:hypothetical protein
MTEPLAVEHDVSGLVESVRAFAEKQRLLALQLAQPRTGANEQSAPRADLPLGPFDDLIASVSAPVRPVELDASKLPPPSRFMVRASRLDRPHRPTKRNYNYFEKLKADLAELDNDELSP